MATNHSTAPELARYSDKEIQDMRLFDKLRSLKPEQRKEILILGRLLKDQHPDIVAVNEREDRGELTDIEAARERQLICRQNMSYGGAA